MSVEDHEKLGPIIRDFHDVLQCVVVDLSIYCPLWHVLRGRMKHLKDMFGTFRCDLDGWVCGTTPQSYHATGVYFGGTSDPRANLPPLSHGGIRDWLLAFEEELSVWEEKLKGRNKVKTGLDSCLGLLRNPVDLADEESLSPASPMPPGDFITRLEWHRMRTDAAGIPDAEGLSEPLYDLANDVHNAPNRPGDRRPYEVYLNFVDELDVHNAPNDHTTYCFKDAWVLFMLPDRRWDPKITHWYYPLHVRLEVRTLLLLGVRTQGTLASLPLEIRHHIARYVTFGRETQRPYDSFKDFWPIRADPTTWYLCGSKSWW